MEETKPRFVLSSAAELLGKPEPKIEWLIENLWVDKARGLIAGNPGVGKTWLALDMLIAVASGGLCLSRYQAKKGAVLLVEEEGSELNLSRRLHAMARARGLKDTDLANLYLLTRQFTKIPTDAVELFHLIAGLDIKLIVFDSLRRFHTCDENSSSEMQPVLDSFARLNMMTEASVILIHHLSKGTREVDRRPIFERLRGSSDFWAWRDCLIGMEGEEEADTAVCSFQFRDAEAQGKITIKRHVGATTGAVALEVLDIEESEEFKDKSEAMISFIKTQYGSVTKEAIFKAVRGRKQENVRIFRVLEKRGLVAKNGSGWFVPDSSGTPGNTGTESVPETVP